ncbi:HAD-IA family hydrolase [Clavibacter sp. CT19]|uniref:HAD-IA family hydrolase n=1 Tax=Clavibacter sp. CT19 TaxID=3018990 RepID=UPI0022EB7E6A|nr:HAD-IA family hydrolase [Clavibacter sp. CT19]MDA3804099.1 HAD-IA family hydrolase [Clavibacter sp. CT19]
MSALPRPTAEAASAEGASAEAASAEAIAADAVARAATDRPFLLGITGPDTSGKSRLAEAVRAEVVRAGRRCTVVHVDDFHNPRSVRYDSSLSERDAYLTRSIDTRRLVAEVLAPLRQAGSLETRLRHLDLATDTYSIEREYRVRPGDIVIVEGIFLLRDELRAHLDRVVHLHVDPQEMLDRGFRRDVPEQGPDVMRKYHEKYIPGQQEHLRAHPPREHADVIVDNTLWERPLLVPHAPHPRAVLARSDIRWIVFDLWETLVDLPRSTKDHAFAALCESLGEDPRLLRTPWQATRFARETGDVSSYLDELASLLDRSWSSSRRREALAARRAIHGREFELAAPRIVRQLGRIRDSGMGLGLVSNCSSDVRDMLDASGLTSAFDAVALSAETGVMKPDPRAFRAAMAALHAEPDATLFVGDGSDAELVGALVAGMHPVRIEVHSRVTWPGTVTASLEDLADAVVASTAA